jgi:MinD superfamily P-loop ATPase
MAREIVFLSGKGGTGKTSLVASFAALAKADAIMVDCDVDAADLHLMLQPTLIEESEFYSGWMPIIDEEKCIGCGLCADKCYFNALEIDEVAKLEILECEGCGYCKIACPQNAITMQKRLTGWISKSKSIYEQDFIHANMTPGAENSGKMVTELKKQANALAEQSNNDFILIDGSPGIGCPVIASIANTDAIVIVIEATKTGYRDYLRVSELVSKFSLNVLVIINKFDLNQETAKWIVEDITQRDDKVIGKLNYSKNFVKSAKSGKPYVDLYDDEISCEIKSIWNNIKEEIK